MVSSCIWRDTSEFVIEVYLHCAFVDLVHVLRLELNLRL
jgi:hypothetical protein